jgi:hypothetical protein
MKESIIVSLVYRLNALIRSMVCTPLAQGTDRVPHEGEVGEPPAGIEAKYSSTSRDETSTMRRRRTNIDIQCDRCHSDTVYFLSMSFFLLNRHCKTAGNSLAIIPARTIGPIQLFDRNFR